jgi:hypothetical protein
MILKNVKAVIVNGMRLDVEYTDDVNNLQGDNLGNINHSNAIIYIKKSMVPSMQSRTLWHEVVHSIGFLYKVIESEDNPEIEFNERETSRLASALNSLEIEREEPEEKEKISGCKWSFLFDERPGDGVICIVKGKEWANFECAKWDDKEDAFILDNGDKYFNQKTLWICFSQGLWENLVVGRDNETISAKGKSDWLNIGDEHPDTNRTCIIITEAIEDYIIATWTGRHFEWLQDGKVKQSPDNVLLTCWKYVQENETQEEIDAQLEKLDKVRNASISI